MPYLNDIKITPTDHGYYKIELGIIGDINDCFYLQNLIGKKVSIGESVEGQIRTMTDYKYIDSGLQKMADSCKPEIKKRKIISAINELEV